ncbi:Vacuolar protease A [Lucilia cuprina]|nr:Vacuolar protease A [Lucilia cuprina]
MIPKYDSEKVQKLLKYDLKITHKRALLVYGCSSLSGYLVQDNVTIEGLVIHDLVFAVVTNELAKTFLYSPCNGLIGTAIDGVVPTFYKIGFQDLVDFVVFSFSAWLAMPYFKNL